MVIGQTVATTEVLVIGAGPGGYVAAIRAAQLGYKVMLVDRAGELGGLCLHHGCIPTKALIHATHLYYEAKHAAALGINLEGGLDFAKMQEWKRGVIKRLADGIAALCKKHDIQIVQANARFVNPSQVQVTGENLDFNTIEFRNCIIATGSKPREFPNVPYGGRILSSRESIELEGIPGTLCVIGGGYIGIEIGKMYGKAGSNVTILEAGPSILGVVEPELGKVAAKRLAELGIAVELNVHPDKIETRGEQAIVTVNGQERAFDYVLVAIGHVPVTDNLQLDAAGLSVNERGFIAVDEQCRTSVKHIYAVGDVTGGMMLAHKASAQAKVAAEVIAEMPAVFKPQCIPAVVFSDPEIGTVGLREEEARKEYGEIKVGSFPFTALGKAVSINETLGFVKIISTKDDIIVGVHAIGPGVTDYIAEAALAIEMGASAEDIALTIHPHPTLGESIAEAAEALLGKSIHTYQPRK
jgi:dihydrolipoamide dehydrogenase